MECPNCKFENKNSNIRCENCGIQLISEEEMDIEETEINKEQEIIDNSKMEYQMLISHGRVLLFLGGVLVLIVLLLLINSSDILIKLMGVPFVFLGIFILILAKMRFSKGNNMKKALIHFENGEKEMMAKLAQKDKELDRINNMEEKFCVGVFLILFLSFFMFVIFFKK